MQSSVKKSAAKPASSRSATSKVANKQRKIQKGQDERDRLKRTQSAGKKTGQKAVQAGAVDYPENPLPTQHLQKPGAEAEMQLKPQFMAPAYRGSG